MAHEAGKTVHEGDPEVSEAIDFARYYGDEAARCPRDRSVADGVESTARGVVVVVARGTSRTPFPPAGCSRRSPRATR